MNCFCHRFKGKCSVDIVAQHLFCCVNITSEKLINGFYKHSLSKGFIMFCTSHNSFFKVSCQCHVISPEFLFFENLYCCQRCFEDSISCCGFLLVPPPNNIITVLFSLPK